MQNKLATPQISTLMAELRVVKIGNKQMTISVFKQLYEGVCFDDSFNILYPIWGKVNRDDCDFVIYQKGSGLCKMRIPSKAKLYGFECSVWAAFSGNRDFRRGHIVDSIHDIFGDDAVSEFAEKRGLVNDAILDIGRMPIGWQNLSMGSFDSFYLDVVRRLLVSGLFTDKEMDKMKEEYRIKYSLAVGQHKMVDELNNSEQLFIAV